MNRKGIFNFLKQLDASPRYIAASCLLGLATACLEGISLGLLAPLTKGFIERDFSFVTQNTIWKALTQVAPTVQFHNKEIALCLVLALLIMVFVKNVCYYGAIYCTSYHGERLVNNLRKLIFARYVNFGKLFFDRNNFSYLNTVLLFFTTNVANTFVHAQHIFIYGTMIVMNLIIMFMISFRLTLISLFLFPILTLGLNWIWKRVHSASKRETELTMELGRKIFNVLTCIPLVKVYNRTKEEKNQFAFISDKLSNSRFRIAMIDESVMPVQEILSVLVIIIMLPLLIILNDRSDHVTSFLLYFVIVRRTMNYISLINTHRVWIIKIMPNFREIETILDDKDKHFISSGTKIFDGLQNEIRLKQLTFGYVEQIEVLQNVSFEIERGKMTAIVGPTGSGKSTLSQLLLRFYECKPNMIYIDGTDIRDYSVDSLRSHMAFVSQDVLLFDGTLRMNITYGMEHTTEEQLIAVAKQARIYDFIQSLPQGFETLIGDRGVRLSGGERQRVSIARAILKGSNILFLDEATSALDTNTETLIQEAIENLIQNKTSIVIAHRLSTIRNADKIVVIEDGKFIEQGSLPELLSKKGKFFEYWENQKFE